MQILASSDNFTQKSNFGVENLISRGFVASKVKKNNLMSAKLVTQPVLKNQTIFNDENYNHNESKKRQSILQLSKKIQKFSSLLQSKPLNNITNYRSSQRSETSSTTTKDSRSSPKVEKVFIEDTFIQTSNYTSLDHVSRSSHIHKFICFCDNELRIPNDFADKIVNHGCDNDCPTDDDQIRNAIHSLYKSLEDSAFQFQKSSRSIKNKNNQSR